MSLFALLLLLLLDVCAARLPAGLRPGARLQRSPRMQGTRLPLYMMQLYRTMLTEDRARSPAHSLRLNGVMMEQDNPALHHSDSVISLVAKSEYLDSVCQCEILVLSTEISHQLMKK